MNTLIVFCVDVQVGSLHCCAAASVEDPSYIAFRTRYPDCQQCLSEDSAAASVHQAIAQTLWRQLGNIPVDDNGVLEENWLHFEAGTDREEVWQWFEAELNVAVHSLMFRERAAEPMDEPQWC